MHVSVPRPIWWLPTFGLFLFLAIEASLFFATGRLFEDPAVGRHLREADFIIANHRAPRTDPLTFTFAGKPWFDYEWGFEATEGILDRAGGLGLVAAFCTALFATTVLGVHRTLVQGGVSPIAGLFVLGVVFLTLNLHFSARPVLFTYLFFALVVEVWSSRTQPLRRDWVLLPVVFAAWANLHAGWAAGLAYLGLAIIGRLLDRIGHRAGGDDAPLIPWVGLLVLCGVAVALNPWGWAAYGHVFALATSYKSFSLWDEYAPPNFSAPSMSAIAVMFFVGVAIVARVTRRSALWPAETVLPLLFFLYEGLKTQRHVLLLVEAAALPLARDLQVLCDGRAFPFLRDRLGQFAQRQRAARGDAWLAALGGVAVTVLFLHSAAARRIEVGKSVTPRLVDFLRAHPDRFTRPLVTTWNAGPLLWNMRPDFRVSFDDRGDFYGDATVFDFVHLYNGAPGWGDLLAKGDYDSAILDPYLQLNQFLHLTAGWREVYRDGHAVVYWRTASAHP